MINDLALPTSEGAHVTFNDLQVLGALAVDLEGPDAAVEHKVHFRCSRHIANLDGSELLLLRHWTLAVCVACVLAVWCRRLPGRSSLFSRVHVEVVAEMLIQVPIPLLDILRGPSASGRTDVVVVRACDTTSHFTDNPLQRPQLVSPGAHLAVDEVVDLVDPSVDGLGILVEDRDLLDDLSAATAATACARSR